MSITIYILSTRLAPALTQRATPERLGSLGPLRTGSGSHELLPICRHSIWALMPLEGLALDQLGRFLRNPKKHPTNVH
jgi:hypothetical protein